VQPIIAASPIDFRRKTLHPRSTTPQKESFSIPFDDYLVSWGPHTVRRQRVPRRYAFIWDFESGDAATAETDWHHSKEKSLPTLSLRIRDFNPEYLHKRYTPWSVFQDGPMRLVYTQKHSTPYRNPPSIQGSCKQSHIYLLEGHL